MFKIDLYFVTILIKFFYIKIFNLENGRNCEKKKFNKWIDFYYFLQIMDFENEEIQLHHPNK